MSIDLPSLRIVLAVEDCASYTRAAHKLGITQPAVSRRIVALEQLLRAKLFRRDGHRFLPTEVGMSVCSYARQIITLVDELPNSAQELSHNPSGQLALGVPPRVGELLLPRLIPAYREKYPNVFLRVEESPTDPSDMLVSKQVDVALMYGQPVSSMIELTPMVTQELGLVFPAAWKQNGPNGTPVASRLSLREVAQLPLVLPTLSQGLRYLVADAFHAAGLVPNIVMEASGLNVGRSLVRAGIGASFVTKAIMPRGQDDPEFVFAEIYDPVIHWPMSLAVRKHGQPNLAARLMIRMIGSTLDELVRDKTWHGRSLRDEP
ncbi:MAG: LysR family transcriptional regulator [Pseudomonadota bacterium]